MHKDRYRATQWHRLAPLLLLLPLLADSCTWTQSPFVRAAGNTGANLAAAATTLAYAHEGRLTMPYAQASFVNYKTELIGIGSQLSSMSGAPSEKMVRRLLALYRQAEVAVEHPCFSSSCDWRVQVAAMLRASAAFVKAGGG